MLSFEESSLLAIGVKSVVILFPVFLGENVLCMIWNCRLAGASVFLNRTFVEYRSLSEFNKIDSNLHFRVPFHMLDPVFIQEVVQRSVLGYAKVSHLLVCYVSCTVVSCAT